MEVRAAERIGRLKYAIRNVARAAQRLEAEGRRILHLNIGDPLLFDFQTPPALVEAVARAMRSGHNGYAPSHGVLAAREAVAASLEAQGIRVSPDCVMITSGASEAIEIAMTALLEPGDRILSPVPGYPLYSAIATKLNVEERGYRLDPARGFLPDLEHLASLADERTRAIVIINPNNPTGSVAREADLAPLLEFARRRGLVVLADEVYHLLVHGPRPPRIAALAGDVPVVAFDSLSKGHFATGWRVGWMTLHGAGLMGAVKTAVGRLLDARLCSPAPPQLAIPEALSGDQTHLGPALDRLRARRDLLVSRIDAIPGMRCVRPEGAFYAMARFEGPTRRTDEELVLDLLEREGVLAVHGSGFGLPAADGWFRLVHLPPTSVLEQACDAFARSAARWGSE